MVQFQKHIAIQRCSARSQNLYIWLPPEVTCLPLMLCRHVLCTICNHCFITNPVSCWRWAKWAAILSARATDYLGWRLVSIPLEVSGSRAKTVVVIFLKTILRQKPWKQLVWSWSRQVWLGSRLPMAQHLCSSIPLPYSDLSLFSIHRKTCQCISFSDVHQRSAEFSSIRPWNQMSPYCFLPVGVVLGIYKQMKLSLPIKTESMDV